MESPTSPPSSPPDSPPWYNPQSPVTPSIFSEPIQFPKLLPFPPKPLQSFPLEVIRSILDELLVSPEPISPNVQKLNAGAELRQYRQNLERDIQRNLPVYLSGRETVLAIARTNSFFHDLAIQIYYGKNEFTFLKSENNLRDLFRYIENIGGHRAASIKHITFMWNGDRALHAFEALSWCNLKHLWIGLSAGTGRHRVSGHLVQAPQKYKDYFSTPEKELDEALEELYDLWFPGLDLRVRELPFPGNEVVMDRRATISGMGVGFRDVFSRPIRDFRLLSGGRPGRLTVRELRNLEKNLSQALSPEGGFVADEDEYEKSADDDIVGETGGTSNDQMIADGEGVGMGGGDTSNDQVDADGKGIGMGGGHSDYDPVKSCMGNMMMEKD